MTQPLNPIQQNGIGINESNADLDSIRANAHVLTTAASELNKTSTAIQEIKRLASLIQPVNDETALLSQVYDLKVLLHSLQKTRAELLSTFDEAEGWVAHHLEAAKTKALNELGLSKTTTSAAMDAPIAPIAPIALVELEVKEQAAKAKSAKLYRSPDGLNTWTGTGRRPAWIIAAINSGVDLSTLLVRASSSAGEETNAESAPNASASTKADSANRGTQSPSSPAAGLGHPVALRDQAWPTKGALNGDDVEVVPVGPPDVAPNGDQILGAFNASLEPELMPESGLDSSFEGPKSDEVDHDLATPLSKSASMDPYDLSVPQPTANPLSPAPALDMDLDDFMAP